MAPPRHLPAPSLFLLLLTLVALRVVAQGNQPANPPANPPPAAPADPTTAQATSDATSDAPTATDTSQPATTTDASPTSSQDSSAPQPALPTISDWLPPPLIVPDTSNAPFMQKSTLPEGTVFIGVGAALGFLGFAILAWRGLVAWSLHRSVKRAARTTYASETKSMFGLGGASQGYKSMYDGSQMSLDRLSSVNTGYGGAGAYNDKRDSHLRHSHRPQNRSSKQPSNASSLFFSPTAGAGAGVHSGTPSNRNSYMPAGFYASGSAAPSNISHLGSGGDAKGGYSKVHSNHTLSIDSPPESPSLRPTSRPSSVGRPDSSGGIVNGHGGNRGSGMYEPMRRSRLGPSDNNLTLAQPPQGRAPSVYLEDLFENHGNGPRERF